MNAPGPGNHRIHNNPPLPAGEPGLPLKSHSQAVEQLGHREASSSSHLWPVCGKDHPREQEPIPGIFGGRGHSSVTSLPGCLRDQGLVGKCETATRVEETHGP